MLSSHPPSPMMMSHHSPFTSHRMAPSSCPMMPLSLAQQAGPSSSVPTNNSVRFIQQLGSGAFGEVWKAEYQGKIVAAKITGCPMGFRQREVSILRAAQGTHTVRLIAEEHNTSKGTAIIMELCNGSLADQLKQGRNGKESPSKFLEQLAQICEALVALHAKGIVFGDLKPDNILINSRGGVVFSDFGDARDSMTSNCDPHDLGWGCPKYHAKPDVEKFEMTCASDLWMLAQTAIHMWTSESATCNPSPMPDAIPLRDVLQRCFSSTPANRPSAHELLREVRWAQQRIPPAPKTRNRSGSVATGRSEAQCIPTKSVTNSHRRSHSHDEAGMSQSAPSSSCLDEIMMRVKRVNKIKKNR